ncbi:MAG: hypothetical protein HYY06_27940 [Deltaproteobacteria bacterium]|nr:hypothetical protein [Deltaproteobacteria bacterium]
MRTISIKLSDDRLQRLRAVASRRKTTISEVVRQALEGLDEQAPGSFGELAEDLIGLGRGPRDLGTNPKHLSGFGRK